MKSDIQEIVELPEGVKAQLKIPDGIVIQGTSGTSTRKYTMPKVSVKLQDNKILVEAKKATRREKKQINTFLAHVANMIKGVQKPYVYKLKVCASHFPMNVSLSGQNLIVKNFTGEKNPRTVTLPKDVKAEVKGDIITITACDKELAGQTASKIELALRVKDKDPRVFQDGIYITEKPTAEQQ